MDKTNLQHFEQAVDDDWARLTGTKPSYSVFTLRLVATIFAESRKCKMAEGYESLLLNAGRSMVARYRSEFELHFRKVMRVFYWESKDYERLAKDIEGDVPRVKRHIERWLCDDRQKLFDRIEYRKYLWAFGEEILYSEVEDHPMQTFNFWLDYLDQMKQIDDFDTWFALKRRLVDLIRVGNAVIPRSEWEPICTVLPSFFEQVQS